MWKRYFCISHIQNNTSVLKTKGDSIRRLFFCLFFKPLLVVWSVRRLYTAQQPQLSVSNLYYCPTDVLLLSFFFPNVLASPHQVGLSSLLLNRPGSTWPLWEPLCSSRCSWYGGLNDDRTEVSHFHRLWTPLFKSGVPGNESWPLSTGVVSYDDASVRGSTIALCWNYMPEK